MTKHDPDERRSFDLRRFLDLLRFSTWRWAFPRTSSDWPSLGFGGCRVSAGIKGASQECSSRRTPPIISLSVVSYGLRSIILLDDLLLAASSSNGFWSSATIWLRNRVSLGAVIRELADLCRYKRVETIRFEEGLTSFTRVQINSCTTGGLFFRGIGRRIELRSKFIRAIHDCVA